MLVKCKGCQGSSGKMTLITRYFPSQEKRIITCPGCGGDGMLDIPDPNALCARCIGTGIIQVPDAGIFDETGGHTEQCPVCGGGGYAR